MSFERREFLKLLGLSASATALGPISAVWVDDDLYVNRKLGLRLRKPRDWHFLSLREMTALRDEQQLVCSDSELLQELRDTIGLPLVTMSKSIGEDQTCPQVHVWVEPNDDEDFPVVETQYLTYTEVYAPLLRDFSFEESPRLVPFIGHEASQCIVRFTYEGTGGVKEPVRVRSIFFPRGNVSYTINMGGKADWDSDDNAIVAFESVLASVEFISSPIVL